MSTWTRRTSPISEDFGPGIAFGGGKFIASTFSGTLVSSDDDGVTWTQVAHFAGKNFNAAGYGDGVWLVGTYANTSQIYRSTNGTDFAPITSPPDIGPVMVLLFDAGVWLALGQHIGPNNYAVSSDGGVTWALPGSITCGWFGGVFDGSQFIAIGDIDGTVNVLSSDDGASWTPVEAGDQFSYIAFDDTEVIIAGVSDNIRHAATLAGLASADDIHSGVSGSDGVGVLGAGGGLMLLSDLVSGLVLSDDHGATWNAQTTQFDSGKNVIGVGFSADTIVVVGDSGNIATSTLPVLEGGGGTGSLSVVLDDVRVRMRGQSYFRRLIAELRRCRITGTPYNRLISALHRSRRSNR